MMAAPPPHAWLYFMQDHGVFVTDEVPALTRDDVRDEARDILTAIAASRDHDAAFEDNWRLLWQLVREANAADLPSRMRAHGPWEISRGSDHHQSVSSLISGDFMVRIWPHDEERAWADLLGLLNWADVLAPA